MNHRQEIPSIGQILADTATGNGFHRWPTMTGAYVEVPRDVLEPVLEAAEDASDYNWYDKVAYSDGNWYVDGEPVCDIYGFAPTTEAKS